MLQNRSSSKLPCKPPHDPKARLSEAPPKAKTKSHRSNPLRCTRDEAYNMPEPAPKPLNNTARWTKEFTSEVCPLRTGPIQAAVNQSMAIEPRVCPTRNTKVRDTAFMASNRLSNSASLPRLLPFDSLSNVLGPCASLRRYSMEKNPWLSFLARLLTK